ncbi:MAG: histidine kinase [Sphingomonas sp.]
MICDIGPMQAPTPLAAREPLSNVESNAGREPFYVEESTGGRGRRETWPETRAKLTLTLSMWGASLAMFALGAALSGNPHLPESALVRILVYGIGIAFCYALHRLLRRLSHRSFRTRALALALTAPFAAETFAWLNYFAFAAFDGRTIHLTIVDWNAAISVLSLWTWFFIAWTGLYLAIEYNFDAKEEARRSAELRNLAHSAKLRALSNQINPHFLFNSLNSISSLILDGKSADAEKMLTGLSTFFRSTLSIDPLIDASLEHEFDLHRRYLAIEQMRYPDLTVEFLLPEELRKAALPALILQPLVENAIKHGVAKSLPPTSISISARRDGEALVVTVANTGRVGPATPRACTDGIGLANVRERLAEHYGPAQGLAITSGAGTFEASITIPLGFVR